MPLTTQLEPDKVTILVAEDEEGLRDIAARVLRGAGYQVIVASDGREAIEALTQWTSEIKLILTDVVMPELGAEAVLEHLRKVKLDIPVVCTSGYSSRHVQMSFVDDAKVTLLQKPYNLQELLTEVKRALESP